MKAAVFYGKGDIRVDEHYPMPAVGPESVLIQVKACGVCGTDVHIYGGAQGATECNPPVILGHEFSGVVTQVGSAVTRVKVGDHVTVNPNISCDACDQCRRGNPHFCDSMAATGVNYDGGFAEYCAVLEWQVFKLPEGVPFEEAALCEPVACALHGIDLCGIKPGDTVMIIGGGTIGMMMLQLAQLCGAVRVVMLEPNEKRFELARKLGADLVLNPLKDDVKAELARNGAVRHRIRGQGRHGHDFRPDRPGLRHSLLPVPGLQEGTDHQDLLCEPGHPRAGGGDHRLRAAEPA